MKVLIFSVDIGPSKSLARLASELVDSGHEVTSFLFGVPSLGLLKTIMDLNRVPDIVITGLASDKTEHELEISKRAMEIGIPVVWFADTYGVFARAKIGELRPNLLFVPDKLEKEKAKEYGYENVVDSGIPLWEEFADLSLYPAREKTREKLGIQDNEKLILFCGLKNAPTGEILSDVISAFEEINDPNVVLLPRWHPADKNKGSYGKILKKINWVDSSDFKKTEDLIPATDLVISPLSTLGITAAYQRKRVIDYLPDSLMDILEKITGRRYWMPAMTGATQGIYKKEHLEPSVRNLFTDEGHGKLVEKQEEVYPAQKGEAIKKMIAAMEKLVKFF